MSGVLEGRLGWTLNRDDKMHRTYGIRWLVRVTATGDGPYIVMNTPGLPLPYSTWAFGNDIDPWAFCYPNMAVEPVLDEKPGLFWYVDQTFSTKPLIDCAQQSITNPLQEPPRISGTFVKYTEEAHTDKDGDPIKNSAHERFRGKNVEFDANRPTVDIGINVLGSQLAIFSPMIDKVNDGSLWGLSKRKIKLSNARWKRALYGTCVFYYSIDYAFDVNFKTFDRKLLDEGTKKYKGSGNKTDPRNYEVVKDEKGENTTIILDGDGEPWDGTGTPPTIEVKKYEEANFLQLGIPTTL